MANARNKFSEADIRRAVHYFNGELHTSPVPFDFRPSRAGDVQLLSELSRDIQTKAVRRALDSLHRGEGVFGTLAAGASSRMNPADAPPEVRSMVAEMYGSPVDLASNAAVPIGRFGGKVFTFLGAFLTNIARLEREANLEGPSNDVLILTNDAYADELLRELNVNHFYGIPHNRFLLPRQAMGAQFVATADDVRKVKNISEDTKAEALAHAARVKRSIAEGNGAAAIFQDEQAPLGHADFFHEILRSGLLLSFFKSRKRWISIRNIDNAAAVFDWDWLVSVGLFIDNELDFQAEVSPRSPGQKGGALIVDKRGNHRLVEEPSLDATWRSVVDDFKSRGFEAASPQETKTEAENVLAKNEAISLEAFRMNFEPDEVREPVPELALFRKGGERVWIRRVQAHDTYWFNNATGLVRPEFWIHLYGLQGATRESFIHELETAAPDALERIIDRGRDRFPVLMDPKPSRSGNAIVVKPEANLWQATLVADPAARVKAVGVQSVRNIDSAAYAAMSPMQRLAQLRHMRMLATKQWNGPAESYEGNKRFIDDILHYILKASLLR